MSNENAAPEVNGHSLKVAKIEGPEGSFEIAYAGLRKESDHGFYYRDAQVHLGFYADLGSQASDPVQITHATTEAWAGGSFKTTRESEVRLRRNIELFFKTRNWLTPQRQGDASIAATRVVFSWSIV